MSVSSNNSQNDYSVKGVAKFFEGVIEKQKSTPVSTPVSKRKQGQKDFVKNQDIMTQDYIRHSFGSTPNITRQAVKFHSFSEIPQGIVSDKIKRVREQEKKIPDFKLGKKPDLLFLEEADKGRVPSQKTQELKESGEVFHLRQEELEQPTQDQPIVVDQEKLTRINNTLEEFHQEIKEEERLKKTEEYEKLQDICKTIVKDLKENMKLSLVDGVFKAVPRERWQNPLGRGTSKESKAALDTIIGLVDKALTAGIMHVEIDGEKIKIETILEKVEKSPSQYVLDKNREKDGINDRFNAVKEKYETKKSYLENKDKIFIAEKKQDIKDLRGDIKQLPLPEWNETENVSSIEKWKEKLTEEFTVNEKKTRDGLISDLMQANRAKNIDMLPDNVIFNAEIEKQINLLKSEIPEEAKRKAKEEYEKQLNYIRSALPIRDELFVKMFVTDKSAKNFDILTNSALINGLPFFNMTPILLMKHLTTLMSHPNSTVVMRDNYLNILELLLKSSHYEDDIKSPAFKEAYTNFFQTMDSLSEDYKDIKAKALDINTNALENNLILSPQDEGVLKEKIKLPDPEKYNKTMKEIEVALQKGDKKEINDLAKNFARSLPLFYAPYIQSITHKEFMSDIKILEIAKSTNSIFKLLQRSNGESFYFSLTKDLENEAKQKIKENYYRFILTAVEESFRLGDLLTTTVLTGNLPEKNNEDFGEFACPDKILSVVSSGDENYYKYANSLKKTKSPMIPDLLRASRPLTPLFEDKPHTDVEKITTIQLVYGKRIKGLAELTNLYNNPKIQKKLGMDTEKINELFIDTDK